MRKPRARVWVPAAGLFTTGKDGALELTDVGRRILDQSMSGIVPYLPNNPLVVEGYSNEGMSATVRKSDMPKVQQSPENVRAMTGQMKQAVGTALANGNSNEDTAEALRDTVHSAQRPQMRRAVG